MDELFRLPLFSVALLALLKVFTSSLIGASGFYVFFI